MGSRYYKEQQQYRRNLVCKRYHAHLFKQNRCYSPLLLAQCHRRHHHPFALAQSRPLLLHQLWLTIVAWAVRR